MIHTGDCLAVMAGMPAESVDAVVTDPPYGLEFMGKGWDSFRASNKGIEKSGWSKLGQHGTPTFSPNRRNQKCPDCGKWAYDHKGRKCECGGWKWSAQQQYSVAFQAWCEAWGREALRVTKPGGYLLAFGGTRTHHRLVCGLEDAGWIIRDELDWVYACLSDDTELLTDLGWVPYNRANEATHAAAFDTATGQIRWERIEAVHQYDHQGPMAAFGPALTTLNHRVVLSSKSEVPLPRDADLRRLWGQLRDVGQGAGGARQDVFSDLPVGSPLRAARQEAIVGAQGSLHHLSGVRDGEVAVRGMDPEGRDLLLDPMQWQGPPSRSTIQDRYAGRLDRGQLGELPREDERTEQSSLEGRRYHLQEAWELLGRALRPSAGVGTTDGSQGRLRHGAPATDGGDVRLSADQDGVREPREPRSDRQPPRELDALAVEPDPQAVRVGQGDRGDGLPPGDTPYLVDYAGVVWCITVPSGAFVARRNGVAFVTGNSGFPKGKANLKPAHEPIVLARKPGPLRPLAIDECRIGMEERYNAPAANNDGPIPYGPPRNDDHPGTTVLGRWPSNLLLQDPALFDEPNPEVVGSGATDVGGGYGVRGQRTVGEGWATRIGDVNSWRGTGETVGYGDTGGYSRFFRIPRYGDDDLRNLQQATQGEGGELVPHQSEGEASGEESGAVDPQSAMRVPRADYPKAFLIPKADRGDREPVLRGQLEESSYLPDEPAIRNSRCLTCGKVRMAAEKDRCHCEQPKWVASSIRSNTHPTVKPTDLMRHLVRLVTPSRNEDGEPGLVLDCFLGSGSTAIACELEGFRWIGIEQSPEYVAIAEARLNGVQRGLGLDVPAPTRRPPGPTGEETGKPRISYTNRTAPKGWGGSWAEDPLDLGLL